MDEQMTTSTDLPRWDTSAAYASLEAREFRSDIERVGADIERLQALFDEHDVRAGDPLPATPASASAAAEVLRAFNDVLRHAQLVENFAYAALATNSMDDTAQTVSSEIAQRTAPARALLARLGAWARRLDLATLATHDDELAEHAGPLAYLARRAEHQMSESEEALYAELAVTGSGAWERLHSDLTSQLQSHVDGTDGIAREVSIAEVRGMATHADPAVRRAAYEAEMRAWPTVATGAAAAMNSIKGEAVALNRRRGWNDPIDASLFANRIERSSFEAMQCAIDDSLDDLRGWMRTKAMLHGHDGALSWWDLFAPLPGGAAEISWDDGMALVSAAFGSYGGNLAHLPQRALRERWIDAGPRQGKVGGAFCMDFVDDRSLVLLNWSGSIDSVQTAAHELGHAYHNTQLVGRTPLQQMLPMALAETASIFCETLMVEHGLRRLAGHDRLSLLDIDLQGAVQLVIDIRSRLRFESEVYRRRERTTLSVHDFDSIMRDAQAEAYGDGLDQATAHPYMWIVKPHYYGAAFYNWPYTFGFLFGLGLFARYAHDPETFRVGYDDALSRCGMEPAEVIAARFDIDLSDVGFWASSLDVVRDRIAQYTELAHGLPRAGAGADHPPTAGSGAPT